MIFACSFLNWSLSITEVPGKSTWHTGNSFWHFGRMLGVCTEAGGRVFPLITLALFYTLSGTQKQSWLNLDCSALPRAPLTSVHDVQNWWLSFLVLHTVLVTDSRGHTTCSAKKPAGLRTADTRLGQSPKCVPTDMIYRTKAHPNILGRNGMEHVALNKWAELQRVESFPCKWWAFRHGSKVLGNQWESFQWSSRYFQRESYWLWQGCRSTVGPGPPRLWEEGASTDGSWDRRPRFVACSRQISGLNEQFTISAENHYSKVFNASHSLPGTWYFRFIANCSLPALPALAKPSVVFGLGHPSCSVVFLPLTWWTCKQAPGKHGPKYELSCRWLSHSCQEFSHNSNTKLQAVGRGKLLNWWEDMIETDPLIHSHFQKICCHIHPRWGKPTQATHAWSAFGPEVLTSHPS